MRGLLIANPTAGHRSVTRFLLPMLQQYLRRRGVDLEVGETRYAGHAIEMAAQEAGRYDRVIVAGGDGTVGEVVQGMGDRPVPLSIIPVGTANCLALDLGIPLNPFRAADAVLTGRSRLIDVGYVNNRAFMLMVSSGIDAYTVHHINGAVKRALGRVGYIFSGFWSLFSYRSRRVKVNLPESGVADSGYFAIVANSRFYGGRLSLDPEARLDDGLLNVVVFKRRSIADIFRLLAGVLTGTHKSMPDVAVYQGRSVQLSSKRGLYLQTDGDKVPFRAADIHIKPRALPVVVPPRTA